VAGSTRGTSPVPDTRPSLSTRWRRWRLQSCCLSEREDRRTGAMGRIFDRCCRYDLIITDARLGTQGWPGGLARDQSSRSWLASSRPAFFEALRLLLSRCHARWRRWFKHHPHGPDCRIVGIAIDFRAGTTERPGHACKPAFPYPIPGDRCTPGLIASLGHPHDPGRTAPRHASRA
jgi:hypothetical protein